jgi:hypothetical protein
LKVIASLGVAIWLCNDETFTFCCLP